MWQALSNFLSSWGSLVVAFLALARPELQSAWKRLFHKVALDIHRTGLIEVSYSGFGPTIGLAGTLRAINENLFIKNIELYVIRQRDNAVARFDWHFFRMERIIAGQDRPEVHAYMPTGFMVYTLQPYFYNVLFSATESRNEIQGSLQRLKDAWQAASFPVGKELLQPGVDPARVVRIQQELNTIFESLRNTDEWRNAFSLLDRRCYWEPDQYLLEMRIDTTRPAQTFTKRWGFRLTEQDAHRLHVNTIITLFDTCNQPHGVFNSVYAEYLDIGP